MDPNQIISGHLELPEPLEDTIPANPPMSIVVKMIDETPWIYDKARINDPPGTTSPATPKAV
jgi:hypothetical protein